MEFFDTSNRPTFPVTGYLLTAAFAILGLTVFMLSEAGYPSYKVQSTAKTWPTTTGVVERSDVTTASQFLAGSDNAKADILIRYQVDGVTYRINEAYFGQSAVWLDSLSAHEEALRYSVGDKVQVHYSPDNPSVATVETAFRLLTVAFVWTVMLGAFALLALYSSLEQNWRYFKSRRQYR